LSIQAQPGQARHSLFLFFFIFGKHNLVMLHDPIYISRSAAAQVHGQSLGNVAITGIKVTGKDVGSGEDIVAGLDEVIQGSYFTE
jgi:hypothetical protein